jgi:hypothetical protein
MRKPDYRISVAEVSISSGAKKTIRVKIDDRDIAIPVDQCVYAYFKEQFLRESPTPPQKRRFVTIMNVVRSAYQKGYSDGQGHQRN